MIKPVTNCFLKCANTHCKYLLLIFAIIFLPFVLYAQQPTVEWERRFYWANYANGLSVKLDGIGNVYVLMKLYSDSTFNDFGLLKYSNSGNLIWNRYYNSPGNLGDNPVAFDVNGTGDVYITGNSGINFSNRIITVKYNTDGILEWARVFNGGGPADGANDLTIDKQGNVIITGGSETISGNASYALTIKYNSNGDTLWSRKFTQLGIYSVNQKSVIDDSGNVYTTGWYDPDSLRSHFLTIKYNSLGDTVWTKRYNGPANSVDNAYSICLDSIGSCYVTGSSRGTGSRDDFLTIKYSPNGTMLWNIRYNGEANNDDRAGSIFLSNNNSIYVGGESVGIGTGLDLTVIKYNQSIGILGNINDIPNEFKLYQNSPNPFNSSTKIKFEIIKKENISLKIFDIIGREVTTLVNETLAGGTYEINWNAENSSSGTYFIKLIAGNNSTVKKMILNK